MSNPDVEAIRYSLERARDDETNRDYYIRKAMGRLSELDVYVCGMEDTVARLSEQIVRRRNDSPV